MFVNFFKDHIEMESKIFSIMFNIFRLAKRKHSNSNISIDLCYMQINNTYVT